MTTFFTKANADVIDIAGLSTGLTSDATVSGITNNLNTQLSTLANIANQTFTGTVSVPTASLLNSSQNAASSAFASSEINNLAFGVGTKTTGPKITASTSAPSGGSNGDVWIVII